MKRRLLCLALASMLAFVVGAQEKPIMYGYVCADISDAAFGNGVDMSMRRVGTMMQLMATQANYIDEIVYYSGSSFNLAKLNGEIEQTTYGANDVVLLYYLGHGISNAAGSSETPMLCFGEGSGNIGMSQLADSFVQRGARSVVVIADCCNSLTGKGEPSEDETPAMTDDVSNYMKALLDNAHGVIMLTSARGENFGYATEENGLLFSNALVNAVLNASASDARSKSPWQTLCNNITRSLPNDAPKPQYIVKKDRKDSKHPSDIAGNTADSGEHQKPTETTPSTKKPGTTDVPEQPKPVVEPTHPELQWALNELCDASVHAIDRKRQVPMVKYMYFAQEAQIRTVAANGKTYYGEPYTVDKYLGHVALAENIDGIVIHSVKTNSLGRVTYLEVQEILHGSNIEVTQQPGITDIRQRPIGTPRVMEIQQSGLQRALGALADRTIPAIERKRLVASIRQTYFDPKAEVRRVTESGTIMPGAPYEIQKYLDRLAISSNIDGIVVYNYETNNSGRVKSLYVIEQRVEQD